MKSFREGSLCRCSALVFFLTKSPMKDLTAPGLVFLFIVTPLVVKRTAENCKVQDEPHHLSRPLRGLRLSSITPHPSNELLGYSHGVRLADWICADWPRAMFMNNP